jgi:hypothetical protein
MEIDMTSLTLTYSATFKIARLDGANIQDVTTGETIRVQDKADVEGVAHLNFFDKTLPKAFPGYKVLQLPTETNGKLRINTASDAAW